MDKRYEEALERAKAGKPLEEVFPELRESEDERIRKTLIYIVKGACNKYGIKYRSDEISEEKLLAYLERQKGPLTPEEKMNHPLYLEGFDVGRRVGEVVAKPAEWSDEDREMKRKILKYLSNSCNVFEYEEIENWLNNLRPQPHWKPSEEQMGALKYASTYVPDDEGTLTELYEQLKKL